MLTLRGSVDCSLPGSSVHGISQASTLEWVATSSSRASSQPRDEPVSPALQADTLPAEPPGKSSLWRVIFSCNLKYRLVLSKWTGYLQPRTELKVVPGSPVRWMEQPDFLRQLCTEGEWDRWQLKVCSNRVSETRNNTNSLTVTVQKVSNNAGGAVCY